MLARAMVGGVGVTIVFIIAAMVSVTIPLCGAEESIFEFLYRN